MATKKNHNLHWIAFVFLSFLFWVPSTLAIIHIVAAENFYGEIAKQLGGDHVRVINILSNPNQDPHFFSSTPSIARAVAEANIVIYNGADYDNWMQRLLTIPGKQPKRYTIAVADLVGVMPGDNPHIWYSPGTMKLYAEALTHLLASIDPAHQPYYAAQLQRFEQDQQAFENYVSALKQQIQGMPVAATEPVFNTMASALGLKMYEEGFQWSVMNEGTPSPSEVRTFIDDLKGHRVKLIFYNRQVTNPLTENLRTIAQQNGIPQIGVTETQPAGMSYHQWMLSQLDQIKAVLNIKQ